MLNQSQIMRLAAVLMLSELLLDYQVVAGFPFVIPRIGRHSDQSQRLMKEVQNIDFQAGKTYLPVAPSDQAKSFRVLDMFNLVDSSDEELPRLVVGCESGPRNNLSFRLCCQSNQPRPWASWCNSKATNAGGRKNKAQDSKAKLNSMVEEWAERMRNKRSVGSHNHRLF